MRKKAKTQKRPVAARVRKRKAQKPDAYGLVDRKSRVIVLSTIRANKSGVERLAYDLGDIMSAYRIGKLEVKEL